MIRSMFCVYSWENRLRENLEIFDLIYCFFGDEKIVEEFAEENSKIPLSGKIDFKMDLEAVIKKDKKSKILKGQLSFCRQNIVLIASYFDLIIKDFMNCYFQNFPKDMINFIGQNEEKIGFIKFSEVLNCKDLSEFILSKAKTASENFCSGSPEKYFKRLKNLLNDLNFQNIAELIKIINLRNEIIHKNPDHPITKLLVEKGYGFLLDLVEDLDKIAIERKFSDNNE